MTISNATRKDRQARLALAYRCGDRRLVRRVTAVLSLAQGGDVYLTAELVGAKRSSFYVWLRLVLEKGADGLKLRTSPGRPLRLTKTQKQQLVAALEAGPEDAGFVTACWTSLLVKQWIEDEFGVLYNRHYVCELLHNLGFSYQKAAFVSDHLNPDARQQWMELPGVTIRSVGCWIAATMS